MYFWKSYICSNKLDVQETNCRFAQFDKIEIIFLDIGLRLDGLLGDLIVFCFWKRVSDFR